ncbi:MAG: biotin/lipoyl-binding protein, partial [Proteobacteria bacterium]|nr:biotin/lipoyl-binding protein [Pseudomonadota bacterium]
MSIEIKMPALSPTMEEGTLAKWLVKEGDTVKAGDLMAEIETDKATMEFEAVDEGTVEKIVVAEGTDGVKVGEVIMLLSGEGEVAAPKKAAPPAEPKKEAPAPARAETPKTAPTPAQQVDGDRV